MAIRGTELIRSKIIVVEEVSHLGREISSGNDRDIVKLNEQISVCLYMVLLRGLLGTKVHKDIKIKFYKTLVSLLLLMKVRCRKNKKIDTNEL